MKPIIDAALAAVAVALLSVSTAGATVGPEGKCEAGKNQESGKYAFCLAKAEAKLLKTAGACSVTTSTDCYRDADCPMGETCVKDTTNYGEAVTKCEDKYLAKWNTLEQKATEALTTCPDEPLLQADVKEVIDECVANVAAGLAGDGLEDCSGDLATCNTNLGTCNGNLSTCNTNYSTCSSSLTACNGSLATCNAGTATAADVLAGKTFSSMAGLGVTGTAAAGANVNGADGSLSFTIPDGLYSGSKTCTAADTDLTAGNVKNGVSIFGVSGTLTSGGLPASGQTTAYGTGSDGDVEAGATLSYTDNGDGTITDNVTGLMWEKKDDSGGIHDKDNGYTWGMTSAPYTMNGTMVTTFLATLNGGGGFAGYTDSRIPNAKELQSIVDYEVPYPGPTVNAAFHQTATCTGCTDVTAASCSCTASDGYWSSTTYRYSPDNAWLVYFFDGNVSATNKSNGLRVRAVRGGL